jgi:hypothetical protein
MHVESQGPSNRAFGFFMAVAFVVVALILWWRSSSWWSFAGVAAATFAVLAIVRPTMLAGLKRAWMRLGAMLHNVVSPLVLLLIFFLVMMPFALVFRFRRNGLLKARPDPRARTYWVERTPPGPDPKDLQNQF